MTSIQLRKTANLLFAQTDLSTLLKKAFWLFIVIVSIVYSLFGSRDALDLANPGFETWVYVYFNFLSFVLGVVVAAIIFFRRTNSPMAFITSLMLITFTATGNGLNFWYEQFAGVSYTSQIEGSTVIVEIVPFAGAFFIDTFYRALLTITLAYVLLSFPEGKLLSRGSRVFFGLLVASQVLLILVIGIVCLSDILIPMADGSIRSDELYKSLDKVKAGILLILAPWPILRLRRITDPVQRQQIKWIASSLTGMTFFYAAYSFVPYEKDVMEVWWFFFLLVFTYAFIITLLISMMRYRLWDMNFMINRALMYSSLTAVLGAFGFTGAALLDIGMKSDSSLSTVAMLVIVSAVFNPVRDRMQVFVDKHFKPEEVDLSSAIVEIAPDARLILSSGDILKILVKQSVEQLNVSGATIYLRWADGQLVQSEPVALNPLAPQLRLDDKTRTQLENGNVVIPPEGSPFSLYIPLVITRAARPDFLGVLVLGSRNSGEGYSTVFLRNLRKLGGDAGKAIYLAQLRERQGLNLVDRLVAIERSLSIRQKPLDA